MRNRQRMKAQKLARHLNKVPKAKWEAYFRRYCEGDSGLREEVLHLLGSQEATVRTLPGGKKVEPAVIQSFAGMVLGSWRLVSEIGSGGMGSVWLAERADAEFRMRAAIKLIKPDRTDEELVKRFRRERQILADLRHPNIASLLDGGTTPDGNPYLVMEYVEGTDIARFCLKRPTDTRTRVTLVRDISRAVAYAHRKGVLHRDIKPSNIMVDEEGVPKLLDFGIAGFDRRVHDDITLTNSGITPMTPDYASPERRQGHEVTEADDIYALGLVLFYLLTAKHPRKVGKNFPVVIAALSAEKPGDTLLAGCTDLVSRVLGRPEWRPSTADSLAHELDEILTMPHGLPQTSTVTRVETVNSPTEMDPALTGVPSQSFTDHDSKTLTMNKTPRRGEALAKHLAEAEDMLKHGLLELALEQLELARGISPKSISVYRRFKDVYLKMGRTSEVVTCLTFMIQRYTAKKKYDEALDLVTELETYAPAEAAQEMSRVELAAQGDGIDRPLTPRGFELDFEAAADSLQEGVGLDFQVDEPELDVLDLREVKLFEHHARDIDCPTFSGEWSLDIPRENRVAPSTKELSEIDQLIREGAFELARGLIKSVQKECGDHPDLLERSDYLSES